MYHSGLAISCKNITTIFERTRIPDKGTRDHKHYVKYFHLLCISTIERFLLGSHTTRAKGPSCSRTNEENIQAVESASVDSPPSVLDRLVEVRVEGDVLQAVRPINPLYFLLEICSEDQVLQPGGPLHAFLLACRTRRIRPRSKKMNEITTSRNHHQTTYCTGTSV